MELHLVRVHDDAEDGDGKAGEDDGGDSDEEEHPKAAIARAAARVVGFSAAFWG